MRTMHTVHLLKAEKMLKMAIDISQAIYVKQSGPAKAKCIDMFSFGA